MAAIEGWELVRYLHLLAIAMFVGGQLMLALVVTPSLRGQDPALMRGAAKRFGIASVVALVVIVASGAALASHFDRWSDTALQWKIGLLLLVFLMTGLHTRVPYARALSYAVLATSLVIFWLGVKLAHG